MSCHTSSILIVDDDPDVREVLKDRLEYLSHDVRTAADGVDGLGCVREDPPDLMLLDLQMPRMDGITVMRKLEEEGIRTSVIVITGHATIESTLEVLREGAEDVLFKPFVPQDVEEGLDRALKRIRLRRLSGAMRTPTSFEQRVAQGL